MVKAVCFIRALPGILGPLAFTIVIMALGLRLLDVAPGYATSLVAGPPPPPNVLDEKLAYSSIEAAEKDLGVQVLVPYYFPSYLSWPPSSVRGQREPAKVVSLLVRSADGQQALQIREIFWRGGQLPFPIPEPAEVTETRDVDLDGCRRSCCWGRGRGT